MDIIDLSKNQDVWQSLAQKSMTFFILAIIAEQNTGMQTRNKEMVDRADLVVFNADHVSGGAYQTLIYAKKN